MAGLTVLSIGLWRLALEGIGEIPETGFQRRALEPEFLFATSLSSAARRL